MTSNRTRWLMQRPGSLSTGTLIARIPSSCLHGGLPAELVSRLTNNPGATLFLGQISLRSEAMKLARLFSCPVVWIAERKDECLPLVNQPTICGILFRTAKAEDLAECIVALREHRKWIQSLDDPDDATISRQDKWGLLTPKQRHLTALLVEGKQCKEIAAQLGTTGQVIKNRVVLIYDKLGVRNRYDLLKALLEAPPTCESHHASVHCQDREGSSQPVSPWAI
jgi:DNA-binding CsgD family transcriptional regulator